MLRVFAAGGFRRSSRALDGGEVESRSRSRRPPATWRVWPSATTWPSSRRLARSSSRGPSPCSAPRHGEERSAASSSATSSTAASSGPRTRSTARASRRGCAARYRSRGAPARGRPALICVPGDAVLDAAASALLPACARSRHHRGVRGGRRRGRRATGRAAGARPEPRRTPDRAQLPRHRGPGAPLNATFAARRLPPGSSASRRRAGRSGSRCSSGPQAAASGSPPSSRSGTRPTSRRTTCSSGGRTTPRPMSSPSTSRASATRARSARLARRVARRKPVLALKGGTRSAGARAAASHTAALAGSDAAVDALFRQAGVSAPTSLAELVDVATLLARQPMPQAAESQS